MNRLGEKIIDKYGVEMEIVYYKGCRNIKVRFNDEYGAIVDSRYDCFVNKNIRNPYRKSFYGVGYLGEGEYTRTFNTANNRKIMDCWSNMLGRCYSEEQRYKNPTYEDCTVCEEWHNFQNFAKWYEENYYEIDEPLFLDKDILVKGNKVYSPQTCVFVPRLINNLFTKSQSTRGDYPIGVKPYQNNKNKFIAIISETHRYGNTVRKHLGICDTIEDTFILYKTKKESLIKEIANEYKQDIPLILYIALCNYKVEITD